MEMQNDPLNVMQGNAPSPNNPMPMGAEGGIDPMQGDQGGGMTQKEMMAQQIADIPIETLLQLVQSMPKEELANKLKEMLISQGIPEEEAIALGITFLKVIYERIQEETGKPITEIEAGGMAGPSLSENPKDTMVPPEMPPQGV